ncbi:polysaccharide deacetylase family protein [Orrella sp. JC864]|uniref:polysaccharide deacetylase family protein n=1 Tax=Orrella sp. JC864 TaxID=3120298 RepID=UPI003008DBD2
MDILTAARSGPARIRRRLRSLAAWTGAALLALHGLSAAQQVAITLDDGMDPRSEPRAAHWNALLLDALRGQGVRAMFFPAGFVVDSEPGMALVRAWGQAGHALGNHTYSHQALSQAASPQDFLADALRAQALLAALPGWCPRLRFPYLDEGSTPALQQAALQWMHEHGYGVASATIAIDDWNYNERLLAEAGQGEPDVSAHRRAYLDRLWQEAEQQRERWRQMLGREPAHVLLLHANALNALLLPEILAMFRSRGWTFIDPAQAFADPIYQRAIVRPGQPPVPLAAPACR